MNIYHKINKKFLVRAKRFIGINIDIQGYIGIKNKIF